MSLLFYYENIDSEFVKELKDIIPHTIAVWIIL